MLTSVFNTLFTNVEMRRVRPVNYKLFQVADLICTMEMLEDKADHNGFSKSETEFFGSAGRFNKDYYRKVKTTVISQDKHKTENQYIKGAYKHTKSRALVQSCDCLIV